MLVHHRVTPSIKVAEHSFQVPTPNSPLLFKLWHPFFTGVKVNHRSIYSRILARVCAVAMAMGQIKNKAKLVRQSQIVQSVMQDCQYVLSHLLPQGRI